MYKLIKIDESNCPLHPYLDIDEDRCYYIMDYTSGQRFDYSAGNNMISNFKKSVERKNLPDYKHKIRVIRKFGNMLEQLFPEHRLDGFTLCPIPPSKHQSHPTYDDRMTLVLKEMCKNWISPDIRELLRVRKSMEASHTAMHRPSPEIIYNNLKLNNKALKPKPKKIILFDDVITAGAHFKACKKLLFERFPQCEIRGVFLARRIFLEADDSSYEPE